VNVVSGDNVPWVVSSGDPAAALEILLQTQTVILSWNQFVYAEGDSEELRIAFASHHVVIRGAGLDPLLPSIASHWVVRFARACVPSVFPARPGGSFMKSSSEGSKVSYEANARDTCSEVAIERGKWFRSSSRALFSNRHHP
jgi:hypothetical protein